MKLAFLNLQIGANDYAHGNSTVGYVFFVDGTGTLKVSTSLNMNEWQEPFPIGTVFSTPHAGLAVCNQGQGLIDCVAIGNDGRMSVASGATQAWHPPTSFGNAFAPAGGDVAMVLQSAGLSTALAIGNDGRFNVAWVQGTGNWNGPVAFGPGFAPAGGGVDAGKQSDTITCALAIGNDGRMNVAWVVGTGAWEGPVPIGSPCAPAGAPIAAGGIPNGLGAVVIGNDGRMNLAWVTGTGQWTGPIPIGEPCAPAGGQVAMTTNSAAVVGNDGCIWYAYEGPDNGPWTGPARIGSPFAQPGAAIAMGYQTTDSQGQLIIVAMGTDNRPYVMWNGVPHNLDGWNGPVPIGASGIASLIGSSIGKTALASQVNSSQEVARRPIKPAVGERKAVALPNEKVLKK